jgi:TRAP-type transport system periplasmic protein
MKRALLTLLLVGSTAHADPITLRFASVVPDGTGWARELRAFGREVAANTHDGVQIKWYFGAIAGDELQSHERVQRDQLDGTISGGMLCQRLAPSMRAASLASEFHDRDEAQYVMARLRPTIDAELAKAGYINIGTAGIGFSIFFSRTPIRTMADIKHLKPWLWSLDEVLRTQLGAMGISVVPLPVEGSGHAYDEGKVDSFVALPSAALAFQWSTQTRYVMDLRVGYLSGCMLVARRAWDALSHDDQQAVSTAAAKLQVRVQDTTRQMDESLLKELFARQGLQVLPVPPALQSEFAASARDAQKMVEKLAPPGTFERVSAWIDEYRSNHKGDKR